MNDDDLEIVSFYYFSLASKYILWCFSILRAKSQVSKHFAHQSINLGTRVQITVHTQGHVQPQYVQ